MPKREADRIELTDRKLKALKPAPGGRRYVIWDALLPPFGVRVTDGAVDSAIKTHRAVISFIVVRRIAGKWARITLGRYPAIKLADAREAARGALELIQEKKDPRAEAARQEAVEQQQRAQTFRSVAEEFKKRHLVNLRGGTVVWQGIERDLLPGWGNRPIREIGRADVYRVLDRLEDAKHPYERNRRLAAIRKLFNWALSRGIVDANPATRIELLPETPRRRVLSDDELRAVWRAATALPFPAGPFVRLLLITGQRRSEVAGIRRSEIDKGAKIWTVPPARTKNKLPHEVPLSELALSELKQLPEVGDCLLSSGTRGNVPMQNFSDVKAAIDQDCKIAPWRLHDLRRTFRTRLSVLHVDSEIAERLIGHIPPGIVRVYDVHQYRGEKAAAMRRWSQHLSEVLNPSKGTVVRLKRH